jgi:ankyrin repeat protein
LHFACAALVDSPSCVQMLIERGAKVNVQDHKKNTPAMVASFFNKPKILQYLIDEGADLAIRNNEDKDAFDVADEKDHYECRSIMSRCFEKLGVYRKPASSQIDSDLARNFDTKNRIR